MEISDAINCYYRMQLIYNTINSTFNMLKICFPFFEEALSESDALNCLEQKHVDLTSLINHAIYLLGGLFGNFFHFFHVVETLVGHGIFFVFINVNVQGLWHNKLPTCKLDEVAYGESP